jgi:hypothetical protein
MRRLLGCILPGCGRKVLSRKVQSLSNSSVLVISIFADLSLRASWRLAGPLQAAAQLTSAILWPSDFLAEREVKMRVKMGTVVPKMCTFVHLREG